VADSGGCRANAINAVMFASPPASQLPEEHWKVSESGWPYAKGNWIKRRVAAAALTLGGKTFAGNQLCNRFQGLYSFSQ
jgi:hypothetical protein